MQGLGPWYALLVLFLALCALLGCCWRSCCSLGALLIAGEQLLLLVVYAAIGGALYERRIELGFEPRVSPERKARHGRGASASRDARISSTGSTTTCACARRSAPSPTSGQWLAGAALRNVRRRRRAGHPRRQGWQWSKLREYPRLLQGLVPMLLELTQPALA